MWSFRLLFAATFTLYPLVCACPAQSASPSETTRAAIISPHLVATTQKPKDRPPGDASAYGLTRRDLHAVKNALPKLRLIVPIREMRRPARHGDQLADVQVIGTTSDYSQLHRLPIARGRFLVRGDVERLRNVAVIGERVARNLFADRDAVGETIRIDEQYFLVVGIIERPRGRPQRDVADTPDLHVYMPITAMRARFGDRGISRRAGSFSIEHFELSRMEIVLRDPAETQASVAIVERVLDHLHEDDDYEVTTMHVQPSRSKQ